MGISMGKFADFWSGQRLSSDDEREIEPLMQSWRAAALFALLLIVGILGLPAYVSPILNAIRRGESSPVVWIYLLVYVSLVGLAVLPRLNFRLRVWGFLIMAYLNAAASFTRLGMAGSGRLYLLISPMIATMLVGPQGGYLAAGLSLLVYIAFTALAHYGILGNWLTLQSNPLELWFWVEAGVALLAMLAMVIMLQGRFYTLLIGALADRKRAGRALEQASQALKEREERFTLVMQGTNDGIWDWNLLTNEVYYSPRWKSMLGFREEEISNRFEDWQSLVHPDDLEQAQAAIQSHLQSDAQLYELEHRLRHKDGSYRWVLARGFTLRDEGGKPYRMAGSHTDITARKQAEEARRASETDMRSLMENAKDFAIYRIALEPAHPYLGKVVLVSPSMKQLAGISDLNDFSTWFASIHPDDLPRVIDANRRSLETEVAFDEQMRFWVKERDSWVWVHTRSTPVFDKNGKLTHFNGLVVDITEQKHVEEEMKRQNEYLAALHQTTLDVVGHLDVMELLAAIVERAEDLIGASFGWLYLVDPGGEKIELVHGTGLFNKYKGATLKSGEGLSGMVWKTGQPMMIEDYQSWANRSPVFEKVPVGPTIGAPLISGAEIVGVIGLTRSPGDTAYSHEELSLMTRFAQLASIALDNARLHTSLQEELRERKRTEEALRRSELRFRAVFEGAPIGISVTSLDGRLVETNRALQQMFGYSSEELNNLAVPEFTYPEDMAKDADLFYNQLVPGKRDHYQLEKRFIRKDSSIFWGRLSLSLARGAQSEPLFAIATTEDISEQKRAQKELQQAYETLELRVKERTLELAFLNTISAAVSRSLNLKDILSEALDRTLEAMRMGCGAAYRLEGEQENEWLGVGSEKIPPEKLYLNPLVYRGLSREFIHFAGRLPYRESGVQAAAATGAPLVWEVQASPADPEMKRALMAEGLEQVISVPLLVKGSLVGAIQIGSSNIRSFSPEELSLLAAVGQQVGVAVENARLYEQVQKTVILEERGRLARELHDSVTQSIYSVTLYAEAAARLLAAGETATATDHLRELRDTAREALREMRLLIFELRPLALDKSGLVGGLRNRLEAVEARSGIKTELRVEGVEQLPYDAVVELYQVIQEALNNVLKHAGAKNIRISLRFLDTVICLEIEDDGAGFIPETVQQSGGMGLAGMAERVHRLNGDLQVKSAPGKGTLLCIEVPHKPAGDSTNHLPQIQNEVS